MVSMAERYRESKSRRTLHWSLLFLLFIVFLWGTTVPVWPASGSGKASSLNLADRNHTLKILVVGNSFSMDSTEYLYEVAREAGYPVLVGNVYRVKRTLSDHWSYVEEKKPVYMYRKNVRGKWKTKSNVTMARALRDQNWDIIIFHQHSAGSGRKESYYPGEDTQEESYVAKLAEYARSVCGNPGVRIGWEMTWAYPRNSKEKAFRQFYERNQMSMYKRICKATKAVVEREEGIDLIIQTGTAIQNARSSYLGDSLNRDGKHLSYGMGRYLAAMSLASACGIDLSDMQRIRLKNRDYSSLHLGLLKKCVQDSEKKPYTLLRQKKKPPKLHKPEVFVIMGERARYIAWEPVPGATKYVLKRKQKGKKKYATVATCSAGKTFFKDSVLPDKQCSYRIYVKGDTFIRTVKSSWIK